MHNLRIRLTEEIRHMPIMVRPEDIKLPKRKRLRLLALKRVNRLILRKVSKSVLRKVF